MSTINNICFPIYIKNKKIYTQSLDIANVFNKDHDIVMHEIISIKDRYLSDRKNLPMLKNFFSAEHIRSDGHVINTYFIDLHFFCVLTSGYISRHAIKMKSLYIAEFINAECKIKQEEALANMGCNEMPESVLGPILNSITNKIDLLTIEIVNFMKEHKKCEITPMEKLLKKKNQIAMENKIQEDARKKIIADYNKKIQEEQSHGLVYDMSELYKAEKEKEREMELKREKVLLEKKLKYEKHNKQLK